MRRLLVRLLILAVILVVGGLIASQCSVKSYEPPQATIANGIPAPEVRYLRIVEILFEPENARIAVALEIPERVPPTGGVIADIMEVYRWSRSYYLPIKCGEEYPPELCQIGITEIYLLSRSELPVVGGIADVYLVEIAMGLDQMQMDRLLNGTPPETLQELFGFHQEVAQATQGTGGYISVPENPQLFTGIPR